MMCGKMFRVLALGAVVSCDGLNLRMDALRTDDARDFDEVAVGHSIAHFANGSTSEAVLAFYRFKDGKIVHVETGATPLSDDYKLVGQ